MHSTFKVKIFPKKKQKDFFVRAPWLPDVCQVPIGEMKLSWQQTLELRIHCSCPVTPFPLSGCGQAGNVSDFSDSLTTA